MASQKTRCYFSTISDTLFAEATPSVLFGASLAPADADNDRNQLIDMADKALYEAKRQGRNRVCQYSARTRRRLPFGCT